VKTRPETTEEMLAYIHEHGYMDAMRTFGHHYVWELTHPEHKDVTKEQAEEAGYADGEVDGYAGNADQPEPHLNGIPAELAGDYEREYRQGHRDGLASYRRTVE
jgi:hypothetical protein